MLAKAPPRRVLRRPRDSQRPHAARTGSRPRRRGAAHPAGRPERPQDQPSPDVRHLWRTRRRAVLDRVRRGCSPICPRPPLPAAAAACRCPRRGGSPCRCPRRDGACAPRAGEGLDYVSCSPFRVPIARLAAAQVTSPERDKSAPFEPFIRAPGTPRQTRRVPSRRGPGPDAPRPRPGCRGQGQGWALKDDGGRYSASRKRRALCSGTFRLHTGLDATHPSDYIQDCGVPHRCRGAPGEARRWHAAQSTRFGLGRKTPGCARVRVRAALAPVGPGCACTPSRTATTSEHTSSEHSHRSRPERRRETRAGEMGLGEYMRKIGRAAKPLLSTFVTVLIPLRMMLEKRGSSNGQRM